MAITKVQTEQTILQDTLANLGTTTSDTLRTALSKINLEAAVPFQMTSANSLVVTVGPAVVSRAIGTNETLPPASATLSGFTTGTITFNLTTTAITTSPGGAFVLPAIAAGQFVNCGVTITASGNIAVYFGNVVASLAALSQSGNAPSFPSSEFPLGVIQLTRTGINLAGAQATIASGSIKASDLIQFRGGGSSSGSGSPETALLAGMLAQNGMEEIAHSTFDTTDELTRTTANMTLDAGNGIYTPTAAGATILWDGNRLPSATTVPVSQRYTVNGAGGSVSGGVLTLSKVASTQNNYSYSMPGLTSASNFWVETKLSVAASAYLALGADVSLYNFLRVRDGTNAIYLTFSRLVNSSGLPFVQFCSGTVGGSMSAINDTDTAAVHRYFVDWTQPHVYRIFKVGTNVLLYVDGAYAGRVASSSGTATALGPDFMFGGEATATAAFTASWNYLRFSMNRSYLETKVLGYRGTFAFEGDGIPTAGSSVGTIQATSAGLFLEDNWVQWSVGGAGTASSPAPTGVLESVRRLTVGNSQNISYDRELNPATAEAGANLSIQAQVKFNALSLVSSNFIGLLGLDASKLLRIAMIRSGSNSVVRVGLSVDNTTLAVSSTTGITGDPVTVNAGETHTLELRRIGFSRAQFLFNGVIQQECDFSIALHTPTNATPDSYWGVLNTIGASDTCTLDFSYVRVAEENDPFLPRSPFKEFAAVIDHTDSECYVSFTSSGNNQYWTYPVLTDSTGSTGLQTTTLALAGGYPRARIMPQFLSSSTIAAVAIMMNAAQGAAGLPSKAIRTFTSTEIPSAPADMIWNHGMGVADDEILVFGGTEQLIEDLDWTYNSQDSITILDAQVGDPYTIQRVGFSFDRSQDNSTKIAQINNAMYAQNIGFSTSVAASAMTITLTDTNGGILSDSNPGYILFKNPVSTSGTMISKKITAPISLTIPSGATLGKISNKQTYIYLYAFLGIDGVVTLNVCGTLKDTGRTRSSVNITAGATNIGVNYGPSGGATSGNLSYLGWIQQTQVTAGTYASNATQLCPVGGSNDGTVSPDHEFCAATVVTDSTNTTINAIMYQAGPNFTFVFSIIWSGAGAGAVGVNVTLPGGLVPHTDYPVSASIGSFYIIRLGNPRVCIARFTGNNLAFYDSAQTSVLTGANFQANDIITGTGHVRCGSW